MAGDELDSIRFIACGACRGAKNLAGSGRRAKSCLRPTTAMRWYNTRVLVIQSRDIWARTVFIYITIMKIQNDTVVVFHK
eukprot:2703155-Rhodomonas_salina.1